MIDLQMNDDPILKYCFVIQHIPPNRTFKCRICDFIFTGAPILAKSHFDKKLSSQSIKSCKGNLPTELKQVLAEAVASKQRESTAKKQKTSGSGNTLSNAEVPCIINALKAQGSPLADQAIFAFVVVQGIPPSVINSDEFRRMIVAVRNAGTNYLPPNRHSFGLDTRAGNNLGLGNLLSSELTRLRHQKSNLLNGVSSFGGTLCSDGAKWRKRNLLNSVLLTRKGAFFCQSTGH